MGVNGRPTQVQNTTRSGPGDGPDYPNQQKQQEIAVWDDEKTRLREGRRKRRVFDVTSEDAEYL